MTATGATTTAQIDTLEGAHALLPPTSTAADK